MYPGLQKIFDIPEEKLPPNSFNFDGLNITQKIEKMKALSTLSVSGRIKFISDIQRQNKIFRLNLLSQTDPAVRSLIIAKCDRDILFFINSFAWTYNPRLSKPNIPFLTYPFQDKFILDVITSIETGIDHWIEKSRDMGFSWMMLVIHLWGFLFRGRASLIGSYKQDYVDEQGNMDTAFERLRYMLDRLPSWLKPDDINPKFMSIGSKKLGTEIAGDAGKMFGTGGRRKFVFLDEFGAWQFDKIALTKTKDLTNCRIFGGTPEGKNNVYGMVMTGHKEYSHLVIKKSVLHWSEHPLKTSVWYELEKMTRTKLDLAKEVDISYEGSVSGAVYPLFREKVKVGKYVYDSSRLTYTGMDFGLDTNVCLIIQKDFKTNSLYLINSISRVDWDIKHFGSLVTGRAIQGEQYSEEDLNIMELTRHYQYNGHFGDPYNADSRSTVNKYSTIRTQLSSIGISLVTDRSKDLEERIKLAKTSFDRLYIDESCFYFFEAMVQSHYPQIKDGVERTTEQSKPVHDDNSHPRTAYEYFISNEPQYDTRFLEGVSTDYGDLM